MTARKLRISDFRLFYSHFSNTSMKYTWAIIEKCGLICLSRRSLVKPHLKPASEISWVIRNQWLDLHRPCFTSVKMSMSLLLFLVPVPYWSLCRLRFGTVFDPPHEWFTVNPFFYYNTVKKLTRSTFVSKISILTEARFKVRTVSLA